MRAGSLAFAATAICLLFVILVGTPFPDSLLARWTAVAVATIGGIVGWIACVARPTSARILPVGAVAVIALVAFVGALGSDRGSLAFPAAWSIVGYGGTALLIFRLARRLEIRRRVVALATIFTVVLCAVYLAQVARFWLDWVQLGMSPLNLPLRPAATGGLVGAPTWLGDYVLLLAPISVLGLWRAGRPGRVGSVLLAIAVAAVVAVGGTRSLWLIAILGLVLAAVVLRARIPPPSRSTVVVAAFGLVLIAVVALRIDVVSRVTASADEGRTSAFSTAVDMFVERPLFGFGPGTYGEYRVGLPISPIDYLAFPTAHNIVLNTAAETGALGLAGMTAATTLVAIQLVRRWRDAEDRRLILASLLGTGIVVGHSMIDVVFEVPGLLLLTFAVASLAIVPPDRDRSEIQPKVVRAAGLLAFAPLIAMLISLPTVLRAEVAASGLQSSDLERAHVQAPPDDALPLAALAVQQDRADDRSAAAATARVVGSVEPMARWLIESAVIDVKVADVTQAQQSVRAALRVGGSDPFVALNALVLSDRLSDDVSLGDAARALLSEIPDATSALMDGPPGARAAVAKARRGVINELLAAGSVDEALLVSLDGDEAEAIAVFDHMSGEGGTRARSIIAAWHHDLAAAAEVEARAQTAGRPDDLRWAWLIAARDCRPSAAARWSEALRIATGAPAFATIRAMPYAVGDDPLLPRYYPMSIWHVGPAAVAVVDGTWTLVRGTPPCASAH